MRQPEVIIESRCTPVITTHTINGVRDPVVESAEEILSTGNSRYLHPLSMAQQEYSPFVSNLRSINFGDANGNKIIIDGVGIGRKKGNMLRVESPDAQRETVSHERYIPEELLPFYIFDDSSESITDPLGGYWEEKAKRIYYLSARIQDLLDSDPDTCGIVSTSTPLATGQYERIYGAEGNVGYIVKKLQLDTVPLTSLKEQDKELFRQLGIKLTTPREIDIFSYNSRYLSSVYSLFSALRVLHGYNIALGKPHRFSIYAKKENSFSYNPEPIWIHDCSSASEITDFPSLLVQPPEIQNNVVIFPTSISYPRAISKFIDAGLSLYYYIGEKDYYQRPFDQILYMLAMEKAIQGYNLETYQTRYIHPNLFQSHNLYEAIQSTKIQLIQELEITIEEDDIPS